MAVIGICGAEKNGYTGVPIKYIECIYKAGGIPLILYDNVLLAQQYVSMTDGILFAGGGDIAPHFFAQEKAESTHDIDEDRDAFELAVCRLAYRSGKPIFGICRGCQVINVALGGDLLQDIPRHMLASEAEKHELVISEDSLLYRIFCEKHIKVNSYHHQSCGMLAKGLRVTAVSADGMIEAFECEHTYINGVQFHPERSVEYDGRFLKLFTDFVIECDSARDNRSRRK